MMKSTGIETGVLIFFGVVSLCDSRTFFNSPNLVSLTKKARLIFFNPAKYVRSLLAHAKSVRDKNPKNRIHKRDELLRYGRANIPQNHTYEHYLPLGQLAYIPCYQTKLVNNASRVIWTGHDGKRIDAPGHSVDIAGNLRIDKVQPHDTTNFVCTVTRAKPLVFFHRIKVVAIPQIHIQAKYTYSTDHCDNSSLKAFATEFRRMLHFRACQHADCSIDKLDAHCPPTKGKVKSHEFIAETVISIRRSVSGKCDVHCAQSSLENESSKIQNIMQHEVLQHGVIPLGFKSYKPKALVDYTKNYTCPSAFEMESKTCSPCKPGTYYSKNKCKRCAVDTYNPNYGTMQCFACRESTETFSEGAVSPNACIKKDNRITIATSACIILILILKISICIGIKRCCCPGKRSFNMPEDGIPTTMNQQKSFVTEKDVSSAIISTKNDVRGNTDIATGKGDHCYGNKVGMPSTNAETSTANFAFSRVPMGEHYGAFRKGGENADVTTTLRDFKFGVGTTKGNTRDVWTNTSFGLSHNTNLNSGRGLLSATTDNIRKSPDPNPDDLQHRAENKSQAKPAKSVSYLIRLPDSPNASPARRAVQEAVNNNPSLWNPPGTQGPAILLPKSASYGDSRGQGFAGQDARWGTAEPQMSISRAPAIIAHEIQSLHSRRRD